MTYLCRHHRALLTSVALGELSITVAAEIRAAMLDYLVVDESHSDFHHSHTPALTPFDCEADCREVWNWLSPIDTVSTGNQ